MMMLLGFSIFAGSAALSGYAIAATIMPRWQRIGEALTGRPLATGSPLATLAHAEQRIAVRRWAAQPRQVPARFRAAA